ncbi:MAG: hypothetical protein ABIK09_08800 [Pseudomonadota bacterium]
MSAHTPSVPNLYPEYADKSPHYEVWYGKVDLGPGRALWFRYTLLDGTRREAAVWAILFMDGACHTGKVIAPLARAHLGNVHTPGVVIELEGMQLAQGHLHGAVGDIAWDLDFDDRGRRYAIAPDRLRRMGVAKSAYDACYQDLRMRGWLRFGEEELRVDGATGMIGHIRGSQQAHSWVWVHCNHWDGGEDAVFEALSARVDVGGRQSGRGRPSNGGVLSPPLTSLVLHQGRRSWTSSTPMDLLATRSRLDGDRWTFTARAGAALLTGAATFDGPVALVEYLDTDGSRLWCRNSKLSDLSLRLRDPLRMIDRTLRATGTAAFEIVDRNPPSRSPDL